MSTRHIEVQIPGQATSDGAGVKLTRLLTQDLQNRLDPFLMLDEFGSDQANDYIAGFPNHPHRGFETITYMIAGRMRHNDSVGNVGLLHPGAVQWMTAGKGVIHSEMPEQEEGLMQGFQLWLNLPAKDKLCQPWYCDIPSDELPQWQNDRLTVRVIAGSFENTHARVQRESTQPVFLDIHSHELAVPSLVVPLPVEHHAFAVLYQGQAYVGEDALMPHHLAIFDQGAQSIDLRLEPNTKLIVVAGNPLREPIVQYGPFVMNRRDEIIQAVHDYQNGVLA